MDTNTTISTFPNNTWGDLWKLDRPLDFEAFLKLDLLAAKRNEMQTIATTCIFNVGGSVSVLASTWLTWNILRSHDSLSTVYHRLVFGLSVTDILSFGQALSTTTMVPEEMIYLVPFARGNTATYDTQGFIIGIGYQIGSLHNCVIFFFCLTIIGHNKKDEYIKNK